MLEVKLEIDVATTEMLGETLKEYHKLYYLQLYPKFLKDSKREIWTIVLVIHSHDCGSPPMNNSEHWSSRVGHSPIKQ